MIDQLGRVPVAVSDLEQAAVPIHHGKPRRTSRTPSEVHSDEMHASP